MKKLLLPLTLLLLCFSSSAQNKDILSPGAKLLFQNTKCKLTDKEKNQLYQQMGFRLSRDKKQFVQDAEAMDYPFGAQVLPTDMNKDSKEEIFIVFGNSFTSGHTGSSVVLFIKNASGVFQQNLGFPGMAPYALPATANRYPDLIIPGPGFEFPVWRWNGKEYVFYREIKDQDFQKAKATNIEDVSKAYVGTL